MTTTNDRLHIVTPPVGESPTADAYEAACRALEQQRQRADAAEMAAEQNARELDMVRTLDRQEIARLNAELEKVRAQLTDANRALANEVDELRMQVYAQKPVIDAALTWAEMCEDGGLAPDDCRKSEDELHDAVESYRLMDMALTSARSEKAEVAS